MSLDNLAKAFMAFLVMLPFHFNLRMIESRKMIRILPLFMIFRFVGIQFILAIIISIIIIFNEVAIH